MGGVWIYQNNQELLEEDLFDISRIVEDDDIAITFSEDDEDTFSNGYEMKKEETYTTEDDEESRYVESDVPTAEENDETYFDHSERLKGKRECAEIKCEETEHDPLFYNAQKEPVEPVDRRLMEMIPENEFNDCGRDITVVKYTEPVIMENSHGQYVFQQIEFRNSSKEKDISRHKKRIQRRIRQHVRQ